MNKAKSYFLGITKNNEKVYLEKPAWDCDWKPAWDCDWYWGFGYLNYFNATGRPTLKKFLHWDTLVAEKKLNAYDAIRAEFKSFTLSDDKLWKLCDYMQTFYTLKQAAELFHCGNSHLATTDLDFHDKTMEDKINKELLPKLFKQIDNLFTVEVRV